jgi:hypothetical protein
MSRKSQANGERYENDFIDAEVGFLVSFGVMMLMAVIATIIQVMVR